MGARGGRKYGDLISASAYGLCLTAIIVREFTPTTTSATMSQPDAPTRRLVLPVILSHIVTVTCGFVSFFSTTTTTATDATTSNLWSILTIVGDVMTIILLNASNFLQYTDSAMVMELIWVYFMISANIDLSFHVKVGLGIFTFVTGSLATPWSLLPVPFWEATQILAVTTVLHSAFHYIVSHGVMTKNTQQLEWLTVHGARAVLVAVFAHHLWTEISIITQNPDVHANAGTYQAIRACVLAVVGLAAVGTFSTNIDQNKMLQVLVEQRTREIRRQQDQLTTVGMALQASETAIAITDANHCVLWNNPALERIMGTKGPCPANVPLSEILCLSDHDASKLFCGYAGNQEEEIAIGDSIFKVEISPCPSHSGDMEYSWNGTADDNDKSSREMNGGKEEQQYRQQRFMVVLKDITKYRKLQQAEKAAERDALMAKAMGDAMEVLTHELRTPLQGIMGITSMLVQDDTLPKSALDLLELVMASSGLLLVLINNLLDIRKCNANMMDEFQLSPTPAGQTMMDAIDFCRPLAAVSKVDITLSIYNTEDAVVMSDTLRLQQCLINLVSNAVKYTPEGGCVHLSTRTSTLGQVKECLGTSLARGSSPGQDDGDDSDRVLIFDVSDTGHGIPPGQEQFLFRKFGQLNNTSETVKKGTKTVGQPHGTGLGLNLVETFTQLMGGYIWVSNNAEKGATFSFCLPLVSNEKEANIQGKESTSALDTPPMPNGAPRPIAKSETPVSRYRVLLVDDTLINRKVFEKMLRRVDSVEGIVTVESGPCALQELQKGGYDLVISDVQMPEMNGFQLTRAIRSDLLNPPVVVGLTADTSQLVEEKCLVSGMADVIHKPITVSEMSDYFETVVRKLMVKEPCG